MPKQALSKKIVFMNKFLNFNRVLCISPHPDDVELGMLGTINKFSDTIFDIITLTDGGSGYNLDVETDRKNEVKKLWKNSGLKNVKIFFSKFNYFKEVDEQIWIGFIENEFIKKNNYDCIFLPTAIDSHFEHRFVNGFGAALCRFSPISQIEYALPSTLNNWQPNLFVDISQHYSNKLLLLKNFKSQLHRPYFKQKMLDAYHTNFQCSKKNLHIVERFRILELIHK